MPDFLKPRVFASKCLGFAACRWNGVTVNVPYVEQMKPHVEFVTSCPEVEIGLGVPRDPVRIVEKEKGNPRLVQSDSGKDFTERMVKFTDDYLAGLADIDGFILKEASPSCGMKGTKRYPRAGKVQALPHKGPGFFGAKVLEKFPFAAIEDEGRMRNFRLREHFYTKLYALARFREVRKSGATSELVGFHASHKLLLMAYNQNQLRILGRIVANLEKKRFAEIITSYRENFLQAFANLPRYTSHVNVLEHALGYFKDKLESGEKSYFLDLLGQYRSKKMPLSACISVIKSWIVRFSQPYLADQAYFSPYPWELAAISDSGKGREL